MIKKLMYQAKLFLIVLFSVHLLALIETAPDRPLLFVGVATGYIICIRFLWRSAQHDEKQQASPKVTTFPCKTDKTHAKEHRAA